MQARRAQSAKTLLSPLKSRRVLAIGILGFSSGLPFMLTLATLTFWLSEVGISKTAIGLLLLTSLPYGLKCLWAPLIDLWSLPVLSLALGRRRSWLLASQVGLVIALVGLGHTHPEKSLTITACWAFIVAYLSATQDIVYEAYRVEMLRDNKLAGYGIGASVNGYRLGLWVSGAGALYLAAHFSWAVAYSFMACFMFIGIVATLLAPDPEDHETTPKEILPPKPQASDALAAVTSSQNQELLLRIKALWDASFFKPFKSFIAHQDWSLIIAFILAYKVGDTVLNAMTPCFLRELGFSKIQIAHVAKTFGIGAMVIGGLVGGIMVSIRNLWDILLLCSLLQIVASIMFTFQATLGANLSWLFITMGIENFACGMSQVGLIAYLCSRCSLKHTATHYAIVSSISALARVFLSASAGWVADQCTWQGFYTLTAFGCLPALSLLFLFPTHFLKAPSPRISKTAAQLSPS